ncbi:MAG: Fur family transcriptional regulator [Dehalococcoidales bacterium]
MLTVSRKALNAAGMRVTNQRALIMEIIRQGQGHLDADEIYRRARQRESRLSLSTVYRTLQMLKKLSLVEELHFDEGHHHYEVKPSTEHHHLVCLGCGRVIEFNHPLSRYIKKNVPEAKGFDIAETEVRMTGYCSQCCRSRK